MQHGRVITQSGNTRQRRLPLAVLLPAALFALPVGAQEPSRENVVVRTVSSWQKDVDRLRQELVTQRKMELEYQRMLGTLEGRMRAASADSERTELVAQSQLLFNQLRESARHQLRLRQQLETLCADVQKPEGWLGVNATGVSLVERHGDGTMAVRYLEAPIVASVDPGSPADRAGMRAGDVLIEIGGKQLLRSNVVFAELLRPGERVIVRLRRGRDTVTFHPVVEPTPSVNVSAPCATVDAGAAYVLSPVPAQGQMGRIEAVGTAGGTRFGFVTPRTRRDSSASVVGTNSAAPVAAGGVFAGPMAQFYSSGAASLAGVQLIALGPESSRSMGVSHGLLVNVVLPGTPGREAGLQGGDILVSADSVDLRSVALLQRVLSRSQDREVELVIVRDRKQQKLKLSW